MRLDLFRIEGGVYRQYNRIVSHMIENAAFQTVH
jgi:hypothetical protein